MLCSWICLSLSAWKLAFLFSFNWLLIIILLEVCNHIMHLLFEEIFSGDLANSLLRWVTFLVGKLSFQDIDGLLCLFCWLLCLNRRQEGVIQLFVDIFLRSDMKSLIFSNRNYLFCLILYFDLFFWSEFNKFNKILFFCLLLMIVDKLGV